MCTLKVDEVFQSANLYNVWCTTSDGKFVKVKAFQKYVEALKKVAVIGKVYSLLMNETSNGNVF